MGQPRTPSQPSPWFALLGSLLPGLLAGIQLTGLLFFLNPQLPFEPLPVLRGVLVYGSLLAAVSLALLGPFLWRQPRRARHWVPIGLTVVLTAAGIGAWIHASQLAFYLPPGINRRLLKAAIWLSLAAVIGFYTVLVHLLRHRPYGRRSGLLFLLLALTSIYVVFERREAFRPTLGPEPRPTLFEQASRPRLAVVALEAATLDAVLPLAEQGRLPFFARLLQDGAHGRLRPLSPVRRSPLWATLGVGKYPHRHGIVGERIYGDEAIASGATLGQLPLGIGFEHWGVWGPVRQIGAQDLRVRPLWDILSRLGVPSAVIGWPLTAPPIGAAHTILSEDFFERGEPELVSPIELAERARLFRTRTGELDPFYTNRFGPSPPPGVLEALSQDLWRRDLALFLLDQSPEIEGLFLLLPGLRQVSLSYYGGFSTAQFEGAQERESVEAAQLLTAYYMLLDDFLGQLWEVLPPPRLMVVVSVHGVEGPSGLKEVHRRVMRRPAVEGFTSGGADGLLLMLGDGVSRGQTLRRAELVDLVPTLLYGLGLPIARDLDGVVLTDAFESGFLARQPLTFVPSYETLERQGADKKTN